MVQPADPPPPAAPEPAGQVLRAAVVAWLAVGTILITLALTGGLIWIALANTPAGQRSTGIFDAIKIGLSVGAGLGGSFALYLAWRRQQATDETNAHQRYVAETNRLHQERTADDARDDAIQRRVTDLYTKAIEQFGSDNLAVQLGGLYALERLAQDSVGQRRPVVNVLCAYLRSPYPSEGDDPADAQNLADRNNQTELRQAIQNVLRDHVHNIPVTDGIHGVNYWGNDGVTVDLTGATLVHIDLRDCHVHPTTNFSKATFSGNALFLGAEFSGNAHFDLAHFEGEARFEAARFTADAFFGGASFAHAARFHRAFVLGGAYFGGVTEFAEGAYFDDVVATEGMWLGGATFRGEVSFAAADIAGPSVPPTTDGPHSFAGIIFPKFTTFADCRFTVTKSSARRVWPAGWRLEITGPAALNRGKGQYDARLARTNSDQRELEF